MICLTLSTLTLLSLNANIILCKLSENKPQKVKHENFRNIFCHLSHIVKSATILIEICLLALNKSIVAPGEGKIPTNMIYIFKLPQDKAK